MSVVFQIYAILAAFTGVLLVWASFLVLVSQDGSLSSRLSVLVVVLMFAALFAFGVSFLSMAVSS
jgi:hypothetical protein